MSRILRRPMFRGGSTSNEGIMSVPRKKYEEAGFVNEDEIGNDESFLQSGTITNPAGITISDSDIDLNKIDNLRNKTIQNKQSSDSRLKNISASDLLMEEYIGNRPDPMGKFLINFGLNYMSARPRGGKFGAFATAADAAKKPTEQLFADQDTDRLLKLKLMGALSKSEGKGAFEKKVDVIWKSEQNKPEGQRKFNSRQEVVDTVTDFERYTKEESPSVKIEKRTNEILKEPGGAPNRQVAKNKAEFELYSMDKLPKTEKEKINFKGQIFIESGDLIQKPNSTDFMLDTATEGKLKQFKTNRNYVDPSTRSVYTYLGPNTFRFVQKY